MHHFVGRAPVTDMAIVVGPMRSVVRERPDRLQDHDLIWFYGAHDGFMSVLLMSLRWLEHKREFEVVLVEPPVFLCPPV